MPYIAEIDTRIDGIPCLIGVTHYRRVEGSHSYNAPSSDDYYGYTEAEWEILDRRGRKADWLERKLTDRSRDRIAVEVAEHMEAGDDDY